MADHSNGTARFARRRLAGAVAFTIVGLVVCFWVLVGKPEAESSQQVEPRRPLVDVIIAAPAEHAIWVQTQGTVEPVTRVNLMAQVSGKVEAVSEAFLEGRFFKKDDALLQLETADYDFAIARAAAQEAAAAQRLAEERGREFTSEAREWRDLGSSEANDLFLRKPQLYAAETALEAARVDVEAAKLALARTTLRAPFDGRLEKKLVDVGQFCSPWRLVWRKFMQLTG
jgi:multidrug efflux pump subunit AcrA (membrane-fusion protein)